MKLSHVATAALVVLYATDMVKRRRMPGRIKAESAKILRGWGFDPEGRPLP